MQYDEFIAQVQERAGLDGRDAAAALTEITLGTLGELIYRTERSDLAAQLPDELGKMLFAEKGPETIRAQTDAFKLEEFYERVAARADLAYVQTQQLTAAVIDVLRGAVTPGAWRAVQEALPNDYEALVR